MYNISRLQSKWDPFQPCWTGPSPAHISWQRAQFSCVVSYVQLEEKKNRVTKTIKSGLFRRHYSLAGFMLPSISVSAQCQHREKKFWHKMILCSPANTSTLIHSLIHSITPSHSLHPSRHLPFTPSPSLSFCPSDSFCLSLSFSFHPTLSHSFICLVSVTLNSITRLSWSLTVSTIVSISHA